MRDPEATRLAILKVSSGLFNTYGYKATSIGDITAKLGMTKGAIYRHFESKAELEKEALLFMNKFMIENLGGRIREAQDVASKMNAVFDYFMAYSLKSPVPGGCPLMNAAIEADDANPNLLTVVNAIHQSIDRAIVRVINNGIKHGQLDPSFKAETFSSLVFASLEGAIMITKITNSTKHMHAVIEHLKSQFEAALC